MKHAYIFVYEDDSGKTQKTIIFAKSYNDAVGAAIKISLNGLNLYCQDEAQ